MKTTIAILAISFSFPVFASNFYVGSHLGLTALSAKSENYPTTIHITDSSLTYGAFAGYQFNVQSFFLGLEADAFLGSANSNSHINNIPVKTDRGNIYGLSGLLGIPLNEYMTMYGRLGWARTQFDFKEDDVKSQQNENGIVYGAGMKYNIKDQLALRFDYRYIKYQTFKYSDFPIEFEANDQIFTVGLQYNF